MVGNHEGNAMRIGRFNIGVRAIVVVAALLVLGGRGHAAVGGDREYERYFVVTINDQRVGYAREGASVVDDRLVSSSEMVFRIARFEEELRISVRTEFVETLEGEPVSMRSMTDMGGSETVEAYEWDGERVEHTTVSAGQRRVREHEAPGGTWLTPGQVGRFVEARVRAGADSVVYSTIDPSTGLTRVLNKLERVGTETIEVLGKEVEAVRWTVVQSAMPDLTMVNHTDERGETLRTVMPFGGLEMVMQRADRAEALRDVPAAEIMAATLVRPEGSVERPRTSRRAVYRLSSTAEGQTLPRLPTTGAQRVEVLEDGSMRVRIDLDDPVREDEVGAQDPAYLEATTAADSEHEAVRRLAAEALEGVEADAGDREKAEAMRVFVHRYIRNKTLGVGFASATEVARTPEGDCTEHAVLLAAMLRAQGIPSRGANGLIYVDQFGSGDRVFGFHMWTQALVRDGEGRPVWEDFDASWPKAMDATHITTSVTDLSDETMLESYAAIARVLGVLRIEVEGVE